MEPNYSNFIPVSRNVSDCAFDIIIPGAACNMKCKYCFGEHCINIRNNCNTVLNPKALDNALKSVDKNTEGVVTIWGGEPLFNGSQLKDIVSYVKSNYPKAQLEMMVNGSLLSEEWTKFIIDNHITIGISHDGPGQKYRGVDFLENPAICNNIYSLRQEKLFFSFNTVYHRLNNSTRKILEYFMRKEDEMKVELGVSPRLIRYINKVSDPFIFKPEDYPIMDADIEYVVSLYLRKLLDNDSKFIRKYLGYLGRVIDSAIAAVNPDTNFTFNKNPHCGCLGYPHVTITGDTVFCNSVVESGDFERAKSMVTNFKRFPKCEHCSVASMCQGLCSALTYEQLEKNCDMHIHYYNKYKEVISRYYGDKSGS